MKKNKLFTSKWLLLLKRIKYLLFTARPLPLLTRKRCTNCKINWNPELFRGCPLCGRGPNRVWVVVADRQIVKILKDPDDAKWVKGKLASSEELIDTIEIETWDVE